MANVEYSLENTRNYRRTDLTGYWSILWSLYHVFPPPDVIHTVGPMARGRTGLSESSDLSSSYQNSLKLLVENNLTTVVSAALRCAGSFNVCVEVSKGGKLYLWKLCNFGKRKWKDFKYKMLNIKRFFTNHKCSIKSTFIVTLSLKYPN